MRYHVFSGQYFYPLPGRRDYKASFNEYDDAMEYILAEGYPLDNGWACILWDDGYKLHEAVFLNS